MLYILRFNIKGDLLLRFSTAFHMHSVCRTNGTLFVKQTQVGEQINYRVPPSWIWCSDILLNALFSNRIQSLQREKKTLLHRNTGRIRSFTFIHFICIIVTEMESKPSKISTKLNIVTDTVLTKCLRCSKDLYLIKHHEAPAITSLINTCM
jgi:hypothetical protein